MKNHSGMLFCEAVHEKPRVVEPTGTLPKCQPLELVVWVSFDPGGSAHRGPVVDLRKKTAPFRMVTIDTDTSYPSPFESYQLAFVKVVG